MTTEAFATGAGAALSYLVLGEPSAGRTLVCHPGGPGMSARYFGDLAGLCSDRLRLVLLNPRGTEASSPPGDGRYELADYAADLEALRLHLGLERLELLGHSHGGFVSMVYALEHPDRLDRLVLACTAPRFSDELRDEAQRAFAAHADRPWYADSVEAQRRRQGWEFTTPEEAAGLYAREVRLWFAGDAEPPADFLETIGSLRPNLDALRYFNERIAPTYDLRPRLPEITTPTLILNGAADFFGPLVSARELAAIPGSRTVLLPGAGHWPFIDTPDRFRAAVEAFLDLASGDAVSRRGVVR